MHTLRKNERITSQLLLDQLFKGKTSCSFNAYPVKAVFTTVAHHSNDAAVQVLFSVSKRHFKHAVRRNRVKRQLREAYRLQKELLPAVAEGEQLLIAFIWLSNELYPSAKVHASVGKLLRKIAAQ